MADADPLQPDPTASPAWCRALSALVLCLAAAAVPGVALAQAPTIVGNWTWSDDDGCTEVYSYESDGRFAVSSGEEEVSGTYEISSVADSNGFRLLTGRSDQNNGQPDCAGRVADEGPNEFIIFINFHPSLPMHVVCQEPSLERCIGPLRRTDSVAPGPGRT